MTADETMTPFIAVVVAKDLDGAMALEHRGVPRFTAESA